MSVLGAAAILVLAFAGANLDTFARPEQRGAEPNPAAAIPEGWTEFSPPPETREGVSFIWAGSRLLAWGGCDPGGADPCEPTAGGFDFNPVTQSWRPLQPAPIAGADADVVWTGTEAIFLLEDENRLRGQAYDPASGAWRAISTPPIAPRFGAVAVWTGSEVILWGGGNPEDPTVAEGAAYDPAGDTWRRIARAPVGLNLASGMWTGREMLVFGSLLDDRNLADTRWSVGAAYDPGTDTWRELPPSELSPQATSAVWVGDRAVAWDYEVHSQEYNADLNAWSPPVKMPLDFSECYPDSVVVRDFVFAFFCGHAALYDAHTATWEEIHGGPLDEKVEFGGGSRTIELWRFADLASTGDTVFMLAEGVTVNKGEVCYGCPGSPVSFWAFRPPA
ncbi:MAG: hypothetical protein ACRDJ0_06970 [Actinomycetota bacterium]